MAGTTELKIMTFIPEAWINEYGQSVDYSDHGTQYKGDNRGFSVNSNNYRTYQYFRVNLGNHFPQESYNEDVGESAKRVWDGNSYNYTYGQESNSCLYHSYQSVSRNNWVKYKFVVDCDNPVQVGSPNINYDFYVTFYISGQIHIEGRYDGFPNYEIYKRVDYGYWDTVLNFRHQTIASLGYPEDQPINKND